MSWPAVQTMIILLLQEQSAHLLHFLSIVLSKISYDYHYHVVSIDSKFQDNRVNREKNPQKTCLLNNLKLSNGPKKFEAN